MIVMDSKSLRLPCLPVKSMKEGAKIANKLNLHLDYHNKQSLSRGVGLAANQIGIQKQVCVIRVGGEKYSLINPKIVKHSASKIRAVEGCLSFPGRTLNTWRYAWVKVACMNFPEVLEFGLTQPGGDILQGVVVQHEISHLYGLLYSDFLTEDFPEPSRWEEWSKELREPSERSHFSTTANCG